MRVGDVRASGWQEPFVASRNRGFHLHVLRCTSSTTLVRTLISLRMPRSYVCVACGAPQELASSTIFCATYAVLRGDDNGELVDAATASAASMPRREANGVRRGLAGVVAEGLAARAAALAAASAPPPAVSTGSLEPLSNFLLECLMQQSIESELYDTLQDAIATVSQPISASVATFMITVVRGALDGKLTWTRVAREMSRTLGVVLEIPAVAPVPQALQAFDGTIGL